MAPVVKGLEAEAPPAKLTRVVLLTVNVLKWVNPNHQRVRRPPPPIHLFNSVGVLLTLHESTSTFADLCQIDVYFFVHMVWTS